MTIRDDSAATVHNIAMWNIEKNIIRLIVEREAQLDRRGRWIYRQLAQFSIENHGLGAIVDALFDIVGRTVVIQDERFMMAKHKEWVEYNLEVSKWEVARYLAVY